MDKVICPECKTKQTADYYNGSGSYKGKCSDCGLYLEFWVEIQIEDVKKYKKIDRTIRSRVILHEKD